jgi:hypothetical protein
MDNFFSTLKQIELPDTRAVTGFAYNALQTVGDNINDLGTKIQSSQIADRIKQTIGNNDKITVEHIDRKRSDKNERKRLTEHTSDFESDEDEVRIEVGQNRNENGWYIDDGTGGRVEEPSVFTRVTSFFSGTPVKEPTPPPPHVEAPIAPPPPPEPATWSDTFGNWRATLESKINSIRENQQSEPVQEASWFGQYVNRIDNMVTLTAQQRMYGFLGTLGTGVVFILLAVAVLPYILALPKAFAVFYTLGNAFLLASVCFIVGPVQQIKNMFSSGRAISSAIYLFSMVMTLIAALIFQSVVLVFILLIAQLLSLTWYILSYVPFAQRLISMMFSSASRSLFS